METITPPLRQCPILNGFTDQDLEIFLSRVQFEDFAAGEDILTEGLKYHGVWVLLKGECQVLKGPAEKRAKLAVLKPGNVFGEMSFFDGQSHSATVRATTDVQTLRLIHDDFEKLRATHPEVAHKIAFNLVRILAERLRHMDDWICELIEQDGDEDRHHEWQQFRAKLYAMKGL